MLNLGKKLTKKTHLILIIRVFLMLFSRKIKLQYMAMVAYAIFMLYVIIYIQLVRIEMCTPILNPVFLINLDSAENRLQSIRKRLGNTKFTRLAIGPSDLRFTFVDSRSRKREVKNINMQPESLRLITNWNPPITVHCGKHDSFVWTSKNVMAPGEFGCACSHRAIWKIIIEQKLDKVIILEDDAIFSRFFRIILFTLDKKYLPKVFDFLDLRKKKGQRFNLLLNAHTNIEWGTESYMVSRDGAAKLLEASNVLDQPIDMLMKDLMMQEKLIAFGMRYSVSKGQEYGDNKINNSILR